MVSEAEVHKRISEKLNPVHLEVVDESDGCGAKFLITVVSDAFNGKRILECHRLVQDAIADVMPEIHAVTINAYTQSKWESSQKTRCSFLKRIGVRTSWVSGGCLPCCSHVTIKGVSRIQGKGRKELSLEEEFGLMDNPDETPIDSDVRARFQSASAYLPSIVGRLDRSHLIQFYALYKQATVGPAKADDRPSFFDAKGRMKHDAWAQLGNMPKDVAMKTYVAKMAYMNLGWDPTVQNTSHGGFGVRPSRPAFVSESSDGSAASVSDREALLWFTAAKADDVTTITDIYNRRPELLNQTDQHLGMTALHWAIDSGCDKVVQFLISKGTDVNAVDPEGNTPLHFAAYCHRQTAAEVLISKGADRTIRNNDGQTAAEVCDDETLKAILMPPE